MSKAKEIRLEIAIDSLRNRRMEAAYHQERTLNERKNRSEMRVSKRFPAMKKLSEWISGFLFPLLSADLDLFIATV